MSKQNATRLARRASRKLNQQRRELRTADKQIGWLQENLGQALKALQRMQGKEKITPADVRAAEAT